MTSFALLLNGAGGNGNSSSGESYVLAWISLALVAFAILIVILAIGGSEYQIRLKRRETTRQFEILKDKIAAAS